MKKLQRRNSYSVRSLWQFSSSSHCQNFQISNPLPLYVKCITAIRNTLMVILGTSKLILLKQTWLQLGPAASSHQWSVSHYWSFCSLGQYFLSLSPPLYSNLINSQAAIEVSGGLVLNVKQGADYEYKHILGQTLSPFSTATSLSTTDAIFWTTFCPVAMRFGIHERQEYLCLLNFCGHFILYLLS